MKNIFHKKLQNKFLILLIISLFLVKSSYSQLSLRKSFDDVKNKVINVNDVVAEITYLGKPIVLFFAKEANHPENTKTFFFYNNKCIQESHQFSLSLFNTQKTILMATYGKPVESFYDGEKLYVWTDGDLTISLTKSYNTHSKEMGTTVTYGCDDLEKMEQVSQEFFSGMIDIKYLKK